MTKSPPSSSYQHPRELPWAAERGGESCQAWSNGWVWGGEVLTQASAPSSTHVLAAPGLHTAPALDRANRRQCSHHGGLHSSGHGGRTLGLALLSLCTFVTPPPHLLEVRNQMLFIFYTRLLSHGGQCIHVVGWSDRTGRGEWSWKDALSSPEGRLGAYCTRSTEWGQSLRMGGRGRHALRMRTLAAHCWSSSSWRDIHDHNIPGSAHY